MALSATYSTAHQFTVSGDQTAIFVPGRAIRIDCGVDGIKIGYVSKSAYGAPNTTVDMITNETDDITANIQTVEVGSLKSNTLDVGNLPIEIVMMQRGLRKFFLPTFNAAGTLGITPGYLHINDGSREKILTVESALTKAISALSNNTWYYIYVTTPSGDNIVVAATDISVSTTAPTWSETYKGWYNGNTRCIGFFKSNASGTMRHFITDGHYYKWNNGTTFQTVSIVSNWQTITLDIPVIANALFSISWVQTAEVNATVDLWISGMSETDPNGSSICRLTNDGSCQNRNYNGTTIQRVDVNKQFKMYVATTITLYVNSNGMYLPRGLDCW